MAKPKITKIKAKDEKVEKPAVKEPAEAEKLAENAKNTKVKKAEKVEKTKEVKKNKKDGKTEKKVFILFRPFVALFRYLRDAWKEIRQVRWPSRKDTWKMVLAVAIYTALFVVVISLLDLLFTWLFNLILGN